MKIINLQSTNIKAIKAIDITPKDNIVQITGKNGAGKSSVLDSILWAISGTKTHQSKPIREGEQEAKIRLDLGEVVVTRKFRLSKPKAEGEPERVTTSIVVANAKGARYMSPQSMLDAMLDSLSFDPLSFMRDDAKTQADTLAQLVGIDLSKARSEYRAAYDERREYNRDAQQARTAASMIEVAEGTPDEPVSVTDLVSELHGAERRNMNRGNALQMAEARRKSIENCETGVAELRDRIRELEGRIAAKQQIMLDVRADMEKDPPIPESVDTEPIQQRIADSEGINRAVRDAKRKAELTAEANQAESRAAKLTSVMDASKAGVQTALAKADLPVQGLGIAEGRVTLDGIPLDQASDAKQLEVSCALAMAGNPKLRVIRVRDGSLMDSESLATLARMAEELDHQVWIERVDESGKVGFVIEDGSLKGAEGK